jgi:hypothetical protein
MPHLFNLIAFILGCGLLWEMETAVRTYDGATVVWGLCTIEGYFVPVWVLLKVLP